MSKRWLKWKLLHLINLQEVLKLASNTEQLSLLKKNPATDGADTFNIVTMLNDNWDKLDAHAKAMVQFSLTKGKPNGLAELDATGKVKGIPTNLETTTGAQEKIDTAIANLIDGAPGAIDTLYELAKALGDDPDFSATVLNKINLMEQAAAAHEADEAKHLQTGERASWNAKETPAGAQAKVERTSYSTAKSAKDAEGIYTVVEARRKTDNTLAARAVLSGGTAPLYTTRTVTYYEADGTTVAKTDTFALSYDTDGNLVSEV